MGTLPKVGSVVSDIPPDGRRRNGVGATSKHKPLMDAAGGDWVVLYVGRSAAGVQNGIKSTNWFREGRYEVKFRVTDTVGVAAVYGRAVR